MKYLLDTCIISELVKPIPNDNVISWLTSIDESKLYISVLTVGEIEKGIEKLTDGSKKKKLKLWVEDDLKYRFEGRIIPIDLNVAIKWGQIQAMTERAGKPLPAIDGLIAVSAIVNNCIVATRNTSDMEQSSAELLNPWDYNSSCRL
jgi:predicted nucleic acid-binding protein